MSDWKWEYVPNVATITDASHGLRSVKVEAPAARIAGAVAVCRIGIPFDVRETVSGVKNYGEGPVMIWFLEDYREDIVLIVRVQDLGLPIT